MVAAPSCVGNKFHPLQTSWLMGLSCSTCKLLIKLPLPKRHAKKYNAKCKSECKKEYLMLDFYEL